MRVNDEMAGFRQETYCCAYIIHYYTNLWLGHVLQLTTHTTEDVLPSPELRCASVDIVFISIG